MEQLIFNLRTRIKSSEGYLCDCAADTGYIRPPLSWIISQHAVNTYL